MYAQVTLAARPDAPEWPRLEDFGRAKLCSHITSQCTLTTAEFPALYVAWGWDVNRPGIEG